MPPPKHAGSVLSFVHRSIRNLTFWRSDYDTLPIPLLLVPEKPTSITHETLHCRGGTFVKGFTDNLPISRTSIAYDMKNPYVSQ